MFRQRKEIIPGRTTEVLAVVSSAAISARKKKTGRRQRMATLICAATLGSAWMAAAQPLQLPTANHALFESGGGERFFVGTTGNSWESGCFGCVRSEGGKMHEGLDIRCLTARQTRRTHRSGNGDRGRHGGLYQPETVAFELRELRRAATPHRRAGDLLALRSFARDPAGPERRPDREGRRSHRHDGPHDQHARADHQRSRPRSFRTGPVRQRSVRGLVQEDVAGRTERPW